MRDPEKYSWYRPEHPRLGLDPPHVMWRRISLLLLACAILSGIAALVLP